MKGRKQTPTHLTNFPFVQYDTARELQPLQRVKGRFAGYVLLTMEKVVKFFAPIRMPRSTSLLVRDDLSNFSKFTSHSVL